MTTNVIGDVLQGNSKVRLKCFQVLRNRPLPQRFVHRLAGQIIAYVAFDAVDHVEHLRAHSASIVVRCCVWLDQPIALRTSSIISRRSTADDEVGMHRMKRAQREW